MTDESTVQETAPVESVPQVPESEADASNPENKAVADSTPAPEAGETPPKKADGFSKRIDELTRDYYAERREREAAERESRTLREQIEALRPKPVETPTTLPKLEDFAFDDEKHRQATAEYYRNEARLATQETLRKDREAQQAQSRAETFAQRQTDYLAKNPEYKSKVMENSSLPISAGMRDIIMKSEIGPEMAEYLADHVDQATQIYKLDPMSMAMEMGYIKAKLEKPATSPVIVPKVSSAPPPPPKLEAKDAAPPKSIDDPKITDAEFARIRRNQIAQRR